MVEAITLSSTNLCGNEFRCVHHNVQCVFEGAAFHPDANARSSVAAMRASLFMHACIHAFIVRRCTGASQHGFSVDHPLLAGVLATAPSKMA
jgi:hypothetical protein